MQIRIPLTAGLLTLALTACESPSSTDDNSSETGETGDGDLGDGDGDSGDGDGDSGDGDGDAGDGDGDSGDGCPICADPPDGEACGFGEVAGISESMSFHGLEHEVELELDEQCEVVSVNASIVELACETYNPSIELFLSVGWTPNVELGESLRVIAKQWTSGPSMWNTAFQLHRADDSLAIAGSIATSKLEFVGVDAVPVSVVTGLCPPECKGEADQQTATENVGLELEVDGETATLFGGTTTAVGNLDFQVLRAWQRPCAQADVITDYFAVFASAID